MGRVLVSVGNFEEQCPDAIDMLKRHGDEIVIANEEEINQVAQYTFEELKKLLPTIDAAIVGLDDYQNPEVWKISKRLKGVTKFGVGIDNFNLEEAARHGCYVANCPGGNSNSVAELTIGLMIDVLRAIVPQDDSMRNKVWTRYHGHELEGMTVGLYGFGSIARIVAKKLQAFDVSVIAYDPYPNKLAADELKVRLVTEDEVISNCNILSLHAPATKENYHVINKNTLEKMKEGSYIINAARGSLIDIDSLVDALKSGKLAGAALDAFEGETSEYLGSESIQALISCPNVVLTPHTGAETIEAMQKVGRIAAQNVIDIIDGKMPKFCVNKKYFSS